MAGKVNKTVISALVCLAVQGLSCVWGQEGRTNWGIKAGGERMTIGSFRDSYTSTGFNSYILELDYTTGPSNGSDGFAAGYNYPVFGIGITWNTLSDVLFKSPRGRYSDMFALYGKISRDLFRTRRLGFGYDVSLGLSYSDGYYNPLTNSANWFFSAPVLFYVAGGGHLTWMATKRLDVEGIINVRHNSSARFAYPNGGLNYWGGGLALRYRLSERERTKGHVFKTTRISSDLYEKGWNYEIYAGGGVHACAAEWLALSKTETKEARAEMGLRKWPMFSLSADAIYRLSGRFALGGTIDTFWNTNTDRLRWSDSILYSEERIEASKGYHPFSFGFGLVQEVFYNNVALYIQEGVYLMRRMGIHGEHGWLYERAGIRYYSKALEPFFVSVCIKAHRFKADYMDFSVGIRF
ncbi:MAG: hypothetical protein J6L98_04785 [Bacteroidales bacterium]|nr:hypothetical protein [Bacteroidales bacterium]